MIVVNSDNEVSWESISPSLDAALGELDDDSRDAVLLRYFERESSLSENVD